MCGAGKAIHTTVYSFSYTPYMCYTPPKSSNAITRKRASCTRASPGSRSISQYLAGSSTSSRANPPAASDFSALVRALRSDESSAGVILRPPYSGDSMPPTPSGMSGRRCALFRGWRRAARRVEASPFWTVLAPTQDALFPLRTMRAPGPGPHWPTPYNPTRSLGGRRPVPSQWWRGW